MSLSQFRILPLLVIVAFLALSVRVVEFAVGVGTLSGAAMAEDRSLAEELEEALAEAEAEAEKADMEESAASPEKPEEPMQMAQAEMAKDEGMESKPMDGPDISKWRDAGDMDVDISDVRAEVFEDITRRRNEMETRERQLKTREALLEAAERELDIKFQELTQLRAQIENLLGQQEEEEDKRIQSLIKVYENMKAADAARIFNTLDLDVLLAVVSDMSERKLSPILANMNPERAKTVTVLLAEQKQLPTLPDAN